MSQKNCENLREYLSESLHLVKAISTLLRLNPEEEKVVYDTLNYKMSWFTARRPKLK